MWGIKRKYEDKQVTREKEKLEEENQRKVYRNKLASERIRKCRICLSEDHLNPDSENPNDEISCVECRIEENHREGSSNCSLWEDTRSRRNSRERRKEMLGKQEERDTNEEMDLKDLIHELVKEDDRLLELIEMNKYESTINEYEEFIEGNYNEPYDYTEDKEEEEE